MDDAVFKEAREDACAAVVEMVDVAETAVREADVHEVKERDVGVAPGGKVPVVSFVPRRFGGAAERR